MEKQRGNGCLITVVAVICIFFVMKIFISWFMGPWAYNWNKDITEGNFDYIANEKVNKCLVSEYCWDGTEEGKVIEIPEKVQGKKVTKIGGYVGRGVPVWLRINTAEGKVGCARLQEDESRKASEEERYSREHAYDSATIKEEKETETEPETNEEGCILLPGDKVEGEKVVLTLKIPKTIEEITKGIGKAWEQESAESMLYTTKYEFYFYVECDENNKTFYSENGKLYNRKDGSLVDEIRYYDYDENESETEMTKK